MNLKIRRFDLPTALMAMMAFVASAAGAQSQDAPRGLPPATGAAAPVPSDEKPSYIAAVVGNDVYVRCGAAESYYPFGKVNAGDLVKVTDDKFGWARIVAVGPAFTNMFGYIKYAKGDTSRFRLAPDGLTGVTLGRTDILAPNLDARNNAKDSWKSIARLEADQKLNVLQTTETDKDVVHKVVLPETAVGWISTSYLERASDSQAQQFAQMLKQPTAGTPAPTGKPMAREKTPAAVPHAQPRAEPAPMPASSPTPSPAPATPAPQPKPVIVPTIDAPTPSGPFDVAPQPMQPPVSSPPQIKRAAGIEELETAYKAFQKQNADLSEVMLLRDLYSDLLKRNPDDKRIARIAAGRIQQLDVLAEIQQNRIKLAELRSRMKSGSAETDAVQKALDRSAEYTAVGRIVASTIYDGQSLPRLLRLQDPSTGRTVAYLQPDTKFELVNLIDTIVGIVGEKTYDDVLRLNIIAPRRIDVLTPEKAAAQTAQAPPPHSPQKQAAAYTDGK